MNPTRRLIACAFGLSLALAACGGTSSATQAPASGAPTQAPAASAAPAASEAPTEAATAEPTTGSEQVTDNPKGLNDLARTLPETVNGVTYQRAGYNGDQLGAFGAAAGLSGDKLDPFLKASGKTLNDVNFAIATPADSSNTAGGMIYAVQVEGLDAAKWSSAMNVDETSMPKATLGGKSVFGTGAGGFGVWAYPKGDTLYLVMLTDEKTAGSIFQALP